MEKLMYPVWQGAGGDGDTLRDVLLQQLAPQLLAADICGLRVSVVDSEVADAAPLRQENCRPLPDAVLSVWVESAFYRAEIEAVIAQYVARMVGYLVTESAPLVTHTPAGERTPGMAQVVFLQRPRRLSEQQWLEIWQGSHTQVALDTQSTFGYRQNLIVHPVTYAAPPFDAIVEENFPAAAMCSQQAFYNVDSEQALQANQQAMMDSCTRFIDFDKIDVMPTSEYLLKAIGAGIAT